VVKNFANSEFSIKPKFFNLVIKMFKNGLEYTAYIWFLSITNDTKWYQLKGGKSK